MLLKTGGGSTEVSLPRGTWSHAKSVTKSEVRCHRAVLRGQGCALRSRRRGPPGPGWSAGHKALPCAGQLGRPASELTAKPARLVGITPSTLDQPYPIPVGKSHMFVLSLFVLPASETAGGNISAGHRLCARLLRGGRAVEPGSGLHGRGPKGWVRNNQHLL
eukprot:5297327-Pyramimonas_sp.AAC.1